MDAQDRQGQHRQTGAVGVAGAGALPDGGTGQELRHRELRVEGAEGAELPAEGGDFGHDNQHQGRDSIEIILA